MARALARACRLIRYTVKRSIPHRSIDTLISNDGIPRHRLARTRVCTSEMLKLFSSVKAAPRVRVCRHDLRVNFSYLQILRALARACRYTVNDSFTLGGQRLARARVETKVGKRDL